MKKNIQLLIVLVFVTTGFVCATTLSGTAGESVSDQVKAIPSDQERMAHVSAGIARLHVPFVKNLGQVRNESVKFSANIHSGTVFLTDEGITYTLFEGNEEESKGWVLKERLLNARQTTVEGLKASAGSVNTFIGNDPANWHRNIPAYEEVSRGEVYEGIRLNLIAHGNRMEKIFVIDKGANSEKISLKVDGAQRLQVNSAGELEIETGIGTVKMSAPVAYQEVDGRKDRVEVAYLLHAEESWYGFRVGDYDKSYPLVIDPSLLASTFIGGAKTDNVTALCLARDGSGGIYISGYTYSADYPTTAGAFDPTFNGGDVSEPWDVFVSKFDADLTTLLASTFLGGYNRDWSSTMTVDGSGHVYIGGRTRSPNFPATQGAYDSTLYDDDAFVAKFDGNLSTLLAATFLGDYGWEAIHTMALSPSGDVYVAGATGDRYMPWPSNAYDPSWNGWDDGFIARFDADLTTLKGGTYLGGGDDDDSVYSLAVDQTGNVFVTGRTQSTDFPTTTGAYDTAYDGGPADAFISKLDQNLTTLLASTYLGGSPNPLISTWGGEEYGYAVKVDSEGNVFVAGATTSSDFPTTTGAYDITWNGGSDAFISKFSNDLGKLLASTFLGGKSWHEWVGSLAFDASGDVFITGSTGSIDFPVTIDAYSTAYNGGVPKYDCYDAFISKLDKNLSQLIYSTFIGGTSQDNAGPIALDTEESFIIAGTTISADWPTTEGAYDTAYSGTGSCDTFVAKLKIPELLWVDVWGTQIISPGGQGEFLLQYKNGMKHEAENVVVVVDLPPNAQYVSSTRGGIEYLSTCGGKEVFWKLGKVAPGAKGEMAFKIKIPWGTPLSETTMMARIGATNFEESSIDDIDAYLQYDPLHVASARILSENEINTILASNGTLRESFNYATGMSYHFFNTARSQLMSDGRELIQFFLLAPDYGAPAVLSYFSGVAFVEVFRNKVYTIFDNKGGYTWDRNQGTLDFWGSWSSQGSSMEAFPENQGPPPIVGNLRTAHCQFNCEVEAVSDTIIGAVNDAVGPIMTARACIECRYTKGAANCPDCTAGVAGTLVGLAGEKLAGPIGWAISVAKCLWDCANDPESHICTEPKVECCTDALSGVGSAMLGHDLVCTTGCNTALGLFHPITNRNACLTGEKCLPTSCSLDSNNCCRRCKNPAGCKTRKVTVWVARDPNAKSANLKGDVVSGQRIDYTVEYENVGQGPAYEVFILDRLPEQLDEASLQINNDGKYIEEGRLLSWGVGDLEAGQKGEVTFSAAVKRDEADGSQITNWAEVHFPSADEITPTNPVVHVVRALAANPQTIEATAGKRVSFTLSGQGPAGLNYEILSKPIYGILDGAPPKLTYISDINFNGLDSFQFAVSSGGEQSNPAVVTIKVNPNPADTTPPKVVQTVPENGANGIVVGNEQISPGAYPPFIEATFSEPIDPSTVTVQTFKVEGLTGAVVYEQALRKATFMPSVALVPARKYTATIETGIKDMAGNPLLEPYSWDFTTAGAASLAVGLPGNLDYLEFGEVPVGNAKSQVLSISNRGSGTLDIRSIKIMCSESAPFTLRNDTCSNKSLGPQGSCSFQVIFSPKRGGTGKAVIQIPSTDPFNPVVRIPAHGTGSTDQPDLTGSWNSLPKTCFGEKCLVRGVFIERNAGTREAGPSITRFYLSNDATFDAKDTLLKQATISTLKAKKSTALKVSLTVRGNASEKYLIAVTDATNAVTEADEGNNIVVRLINE